jgi:hypothetical protein
MDNFLAALGFVVSVLVAYVAGYIVGEDDAVPAHCKPLKITAVAGEQLPVPVRGYVCMKRGK